MQQYNTKDYFQNGTVIGTAIKLIRQRPHLDATTAQRALPWSQALFVFTRVVSVGVTVSVQLACI